MTDRKEFRRGREAGKRWAISCEPSDRERFWKNRRDMDDPDSESVFNAIFETDDDDPEDDNWEARHAKFWGVELFGDPPHQDFVRGFVAGARPIVAAVARAMKAKAATGPKLAGRHTRIRKTRR